MSSDIHALAGAYALAAVDDLERTAFERHLADCEPCRLEVAELRETVARLAEATAVGTPPPGLRERTLAQAASTPQLRVGTGPTGVTRGTPQWRRWAAAAAVVGIAAAGASAATWSVAGDRVRQEQASSDQARQVADVLSAPDARVHDQPLQAGGAATVVVSRDRDRGVVLLRDLPEPGIGRAYQLWLIRDTEKARPVGLLTAGATETTMVIGPVAASDTFGLSNEPAGGSTAPTRIVGVVALS
ncbi:anti-sigma factor [Plantactinospora soyae]|uniref:Regulator of SigK n=1 Tax=Plantactinospora soyae TaxID=1544732 RepID=A0A927M7L2_9ACTN|nr:anti-sigma factor [Plantactinospora soyae]MBE1489648.1 anti-sigma-K factor RskA [Plantactinospora soyae]